jgi:hypothetical protein
VANYYKVKFDCFKIEKNKTFVISPQTVYIKFITISKEVHIKLVRSQQQVCNKVIRSS